MYGVTLAHAFALQPPSKLRTLKVFSTIGLTAVISWPFAGVLAAVLALHDLVQREWTRSIISELLWGFIHAGVVVLLGLVFARRSYSLFLLDQDCPGVYRFHSLQANSNCSAQYCSIQRLF